MTWNLLRDAFLTNFVSGSSGQGLGIGSRAFKPIRNTSCNEISRDSIVVRVSRFAASRPLYRWGTPSAMAGLKLLALIYTFLVSWWLFLLEWRCFIAQAQHMSLCLQTEGQCQSLFCQRHGVPNAIQRATPKSLFFPIDKRCDYPQKKCLGHNSPKL